MEIRKNVKKFFKFLKDKTKTLPKPSLENFLIGLILFSNFLLALSIRLIPLKYGGILTEFDPYFQYYMTNWIVNQGWYGFISWFYYGVDKTMWYPSGRDIPATAYPGVAFVGAFVYLIIQSLGINAPVMYIVGFIPPFSAAITTILIYFIGKEIHSKTTGLIASFLFAISAATVGRTVYGFYDDDSISQIYISLFAYGLIKSFKETSLKWPILIGISLSLLSITWGSYTYFLNLYALLIIILILIGRYRKEIGKTYLIGMTMPIIVLSLLPKTSSFFIISQFAFLPLLAYVLILFNNYISLPREKLYLYILATIIGGFILAYLLQKFNIVYGIYDKFIMVLNPFAKSGNPWIESVGEHAATTWIQFFINFGLAFLFIPLGFYILIKRAKEQDIFLVLFGLTSLHATATVNRLFMISAQPLILLASIALASVLISFAENLKEKKTFIERKRVRLFKGIPPSWVALLFIIILLISSLQIYVVKPNPLNISNAPPSILSSETGEVIDDWIATFQWIRDNIPKDAVIASWWDYGYWITVNTGRISVADNANYNFTQINLIARALVSDENTSLDIFRKFKASYVLVYEQFINVGTGEFIPFGGDLEKSYWMVRIAFNYDDYTTRKLYLNSTNVRIGFSTITLTLPTGEKAKDALIYKLLFTKIPLVREKFIKEIEDLKISPPTYFQLVYYSPKGYVLLFKIIYPEERSKP